MHFTVSYVRQFVWIQYGLPTFLDGMGLSSRDMLSWHAWDILYVPAFLCDMENLPIIRSR